jgi:sulfatase modifying factor 1
MPSDVTQGDSTEGDTISTSDVEADTAPVRPSFVRIEPGAFVMGSDSEMALDFEKPMHGVTLTRAFYMATTEVTQAEYEDVMGKNIALFGGCPDCPVERVKWHEAIAYCNALSEREGYAQCYETLEVGDQILFKGLHCTGYRLPVEAEWEYAARAGTVTLWNCGDDPACLTTFSWIKENSASKTHPVGQLEPNAWGLYDMGGNVFEWVWDWHMPDFYAESPSQDPLGPEEGNHRVYRGGAWSSEPELVRTSDRSINVPNEVEGTPCGGQFCWPESEDGTKWHYHSPDLGFRVVRTADD